MEVGSKKFKPIVLALAATFAVTVSGAALANSSLQTTNLTQGYQLVADTTATGGCKTATATDKTAKGSCHKKAKASHKTAKGGCHKKATDKAAKGGCKTASSN